MQLRGAGLGIANISLDVTGPGGFKVSHGWPIQVRASQLDVSREDQLPLAPGASYTANRSAVSDLVASTASGLSSYTGIRGRRPELSS